MNSASLQEAIPHRPKSYDIGRYRTTQKKNQNQTIDEKKKKRVYISLWLFLSEKNIKTGVQPRISSHAGGVNHESSYEQGNRRDQH